jgi:glutaconate CoA-transferase subunit A
MASKVRTLDAALALVADGAALGVGGVLLHRKPAAFLAALAAAGHRDLRLVTFLASLDAELLAALGALAEADVGYAGFEQLGPAPAFEAAVERGAVALREHTELQFVTGLRAAGAGLPFLPTRGGTGSAVTAERGLATVRCPYSGEELLAVPALRLDVAVIHAEAADEEGNVLAPRWPTFLHDADTVLARAARQVVVTVERLAPRAEVVAAGRTALFGFEVDAVVVLPGGARPCALPGAYDADLTAIRAYLAAATADPAAAGAAMTALTGAA